MERSRFFSQQILNKTPITKTLQNKIIANLFFENSTRTKFSFEVAAKRLGADVLNFTTEASSLSKGESLYDTLKTFESLGIDIGIIRHSDDHYIEEAKNTFQFNIINAGAGKKEHPSQSLLDLFTIKEEFGSLDGLTITICGDIKSSRVAKSNIAALGKFDCKVNLCGPKELLPEEKDIPVHCGLKTLDEAMPESDVVMFLRIQHERHAAFELETENYTDHYGLNEQRINLLKEKAIIMHPGPVNRDVEISSHLVEHEKSRIFKQMENGVYTRMAILEWIAGVFDNE